MASRRQIAANRENGLKGGVKTEEGKLISRLNARKHGIFVSALTTEDSEDLYGVEDELVASLRPVGRVEEMLVEKLALTYLRMQRCARAEAEYHVQTWEEPNEELEWRSWEQLREKRKYGARAVTFREEVFERMVKLIDLYDARLTNQFLKLIHEIERLQRLRAGKEGAAAPQSREDLSRSPSEKCGTGASPVRATAPLAERDCATPPTASADQASSPEATQTSCPPSQPLSFAPPVAQTPSGVPNCLPASSPEQAPEPSQVVDAKEADAPMTL
jgi:hypothetical protein